MVEMDIQSTIGVEIAREKGPDYMGHRKRLREKYASQGAVALQDYELLELLLSFSIPHRDTKPYAKKLLSVFKNVRRILEADTAALQTLGELPPQSALHFKAMGDLFRLAHQEEFKRGRAVTNPEDVASFLREQIGSRPREVFTAIFLDHRNHLVAFEHLQEGTVDHTAVYPREILKRALELNATGLILAHNHPAGSLEPSEGDKQLTRQILTAARAMGITVHDHLILTTEGHFSFRQAGLLV
ncbi:MAG TPA: DNA repair protein RadC [bacterium]|nr:DNA repair protein RadC [bacterium]